jgi:putative endonuclease
MSAYTYVLKLEKDNYYVGMTTKPEQRFDQHFSGNGSKWTQVHKPVEVVHVEKHKNVETAKKAETQTYYQAKNIHGKDKVRGAGNTKSY